MNDQSRKDLASYSTEELLAFVSSRAIRSRGDVIDNPRIVTARLAKYAAAEKEHFIVILLDATHRIKEEVVCSVGTMTASLVHPREVFRDAIVKGAAAIIVAHNHPSGDEAPSREDRETTRRLQEAGRIVGIPVLDHVIIAKGGSFSFRQQGLLDA